MEEYKLGRRIAEGRFGVVFEATAVSTGQRVAAKKIRPRRLMPGLTEDPWLRSSQREVEVLTCARHRNVVALLDHFVDAAYTLLIYEFLAWDLAGLLESRKTMGEADVKAVLQMLLCGLAYLHGKGIMHRDLKPSNLLLDGSSGELKIADFGSARFAGAALAAPALEEATVPEEFGSRPMTQDVCTRWYKSPEMLFGSIDYTHAVDLWAAGCIAGELFSPGFKPLFAGRSDLDQICRIFEVCGTPDIETWPEVRQLPDYGKVEFLPRDPKELPFEDALGSPAAAQLVRRFLVLPPVQRISASDALEEEFFLVEPQAGDPAGLIEGLDPASASRANPEDEDCGTPFFQSDVGSDDSFLQHPNDEYEPVLIETTSCGLWDRGDIVDGTDEAGSDGEANAANRGRQRCGTPPPPVQGEWRFKTHLHQ